MGNRQLTHTTSTINRPPYKHIIRTTTGWEYVPSVGTHARVQALYFPDEHVPLWLRLLHGSPFASVQATPATKQSLRIRLLPEIGTVPPPEYDVAATAQAAIERLTGSLPQQEPRVNAFEIEHGCAWGRHLIDPFRTILQEQGYTLDGDCGLAGRAKRIVRYTQRVR